jgi:hypothetical protein
VEGKNKFGAGNKRGNRNHPTKSLRKITGERTIKEL